MASRKKQEKKKKGLRVGFVSSDTPTSGRDIRKQTGELFTGREGRIDKPRDFTRKGGPEIGAAEFKRLSDPQTGLNARRFSGVTEGKAEPQEKIKRRESETKIFDEQADKNTAKDQELVDRQRAENPEAFASFDRAKAEFEQAEQESPFENPEDRETRSKLRQIMDDPRTPIALGIAILGVLTAGAATGVIGGAAAAGGVGASISGTTAAGATIVEGATIARTLATVGRTLPKTTRALKAFGKAGAKVGKWTPKGKGLAEFGATNLGKTIKTGAIIGGSVAGADTLATWFAADNIRSSIPFQLSDTVTAYQQGAISLEQANEYFNQAEEQLEFTTKEIDFSTAANPALWAARNRFKAGDQTVRNAIELKRLGLTQGTGGQR